MTGKNSNLIQSWLNLQCQLLAEPIRAAVLLCDAGTDAYQPAATWPEGTMITPALSHAAASAIRSGRALIQPLEKAPPAAQQEGHVVACALPGAGELRGAAVVEITPDTGADVRAAARMLRGNWVWLKLLRDAQQPETHDAFRNAVELVATSLEFSQFEAAARAVVTQLAAQLGCERVSLGVVRRQRIRVRAISGSADTDDRMQLLQATASAMEEAIDQDLSLVFPPLGTTANHVDRAHTSLAELSSASSILTVPISHEDQLVGAITFEHETRDFFNTEVVALCDMAVSLVGPLLYTKHQRDRWFGAKLAEALGQLGRSVFGPEHLLLKVGATAALTLMIFLTLASSEYRITAEATLEGRVHRMIVAPLNGYVSDVAARAGDKVKKGDVLCQLDDKDLKLEHVKMSSEKAQLLREYREAMAQHDSAQVTILKAQVDRTSAQLALVEEQLARLRVTAPLSGVVVQENLSKSLGVPVERGQLLFEVAPLDSYRVMLQVDEREIAELSPGQQGRLALVGFPDRKLPFQIERVTPISAPVDGRNFFAVEARLRETPTLLRPGMQGIGKVDIGSRRLLWIWTHRLIDWLRLQLWSWTP